MTVDKNERDALLGRKISAAISRAGTDGPCPHCEEIAALVDGKLSDAERDLLMIHLAGCKECFQLYTLTAEQVHPEERHSSRNWVVLTGSIAAVLVAVFGLVMATRPPKQQVALHTSPSKAVPGAAVPSAEVARTDHSLARQTNIDEEQLATVAMNMARHLSKNVSYAPVAVDKAMGFAVQTDKNRDHISLGRNLFLLEINLARNDRATALRTLAEITRMAQRLNLPVETGNALKRVAEEVARRTNLDGARGQVTRAVSSALDREGRSYLTLGEWAQGAIMAAGAEQPAYFTSGYFVRISADLASASFPAKIAPLVREMTDLGRHTPLGESEYRRIEIVAEELAGE